MKIRPVGADLIHVDGQTWRNLQSAFLNFANAPKNVMAALKDTLNEDFHKHF